MSDSDLEKIKAQARKRAGKPTTKSELAEGIWLMRTLQERHPRAYALIFHIPNGGFRSGAGARNLSLSGVKSGVPDYFLAMHKLVRVGNVAIWRHGLFIELKRATDKKGKRGGRVSKQQLDWKERLEQQGYQVSICWGGLEALRVIEEYIAD